MGDTPRKWFPQRQAGCQAVFGAECVWFAILTARTGFGLYSVLFLLIAVSAFLDWRALATGRRGPGVELRQDGLTIVDWRRNRRHVPWASVVYLRDHGDWAMLGTDKEPLVLNRATAGFRELVDEIARHVPPRAALAEDTRELDAAEVAQALGITEDGALECRPHHSSPGGGRRAQEVRADVQGLSARFGREWLRVPWSAVRDIWRSGAMADLYGAPSFDHVTIETDGGLIRFLPTSSGAAAMESGIRALLAARDAGRALPSAAPLSAAALSQARLTGESDAERGLSQVAEDEAGN
jgi:hypothetical protein